VPDFEFTQPQVDLIRARRHIYVEACPGAGKTQAIVERFVERPLKHPRKGVGLLSFTNVAIDEARLRCAPEPHLREVPNYIGTIDGFINRFLVGPTFLARKHIAPTFTEAWSSVPHSQVSAPGVRWRPSLDWFSIDGVSASLVTNRVPIEQRAAVASLAPQQVESLQAQAMALWTSFVTRGVLSASASRVALRAYLSESERRHQLGRLLADRFVEIIVDEVQDCSADDLLVLNLLRDFGVTIVAVGDPDQSIYAFRSDVPADLASFLRSLGRGSRLNGNFRSTPAICSLVDSLRMGDATDEPIGPRADSDTPVVLVPYRRRAELPEKFARILESHGISNERFVVLAHSAEHARTAAGSPAKGGEGTNRLVLLAGAHPMPLS
jgi:DNA helicase-2/ATP-dependent DNA helicase PcrA